MKPFAFAVLCVSALALPAQTRLDAWRVIGPGGGGAQFNPTISPHDVNRVLVNCDMTGAYITHDGGASWRMFNLRGTVRFFAFDPSRPDVIYAQTVGLWRSQDAGRTWRLVFPKASDVRGIVHPDDHAQDVLQVSGTRESVAALAVDPAAPEVLYAAFSSSGKLSLRRSADGGASWSAMADLPGGAARLIIDPNSPKNDRTIYVIEKNAVAVREAGKWRQGPPAPAPFTGVSAGFPRAGGPLHIWALAEGILHSADGGATWKRVDDGLKAARYRAIATSLNHPETAYVSYSGLKSDGETFFGVARTSDSGKTWKTLWRESSRKSPDVDDGWVSDRFGPGWGSNPLALGVAPTNPDICYATDYGRTLRTTDGGKTWRAVYTRRVSDGRFTSTGLDVTTSYGVHWDPFQPARMFISYTDISFFRSDDGGKTWDGALAQGIPRAWRNTTYWMEFDPKVKGRVWAVMSGTHDLPRPKMWRRTEPSTYQGGVLRSEDGGLSWKPLTNGIPPTAATHILLDPHSPVSARVLYVTGFGRGVFKSTDGGESWTLKNEGLPGREPFAWRLTLAPDKMLYLVIARRSEDGSFGNPNDGALYRSKDGAGHWTRVPLPEGLNGPNGLAVDPRDPRRLYLASWGRRTPDGAVMGGVWLSEDAGATWRCILDRDQHVYDVTIDPRNPDTLYACGFESSAWRSDDRGKTWQRIRGYNFKWGHRVIPDPHNPRMIYITTFGGSVWHGPAAGDPKAVEDIVTPELAYSRP